MNDHDKQRRSIRLKEYDYRQAGAYFVTIVTQDRSCLFGDVVNGKMQLNDAGQMVHAVWDDLPKYYPGVETDIFVVMPNHIHGVIFLVGAGPCACPEFGGQPQGVAPTINASANLVAQHLSLPDVLHRFKTLTTQRYTRGVKKTGWSRFNSRLWQRNYFEHVIRSEDSLNRIRQYIFDNPVRWEFDRDNPAAMKPESEYAWRQ
jgi:REP element-mobilizing transposase RayT